MSVWTALHSRIIGWLYLLFAYGHNPFIFPHSHSFDAAIVTSALAVAHALIACWLLGLRMDSKLPLVPILAGTLLVVALLGQAAAVTIGIQTDWLMDTSGTASQILFQLLESLIFYLIALAPVFLLRVRHTQGGEQTAE